MINHTNADAQSKPSIQQQDLGDRIAAHYYSEDLADSNASGRSDFVRQYIDTDPMSGVIGQQEFAIPPDLWSLDSLSLQCKSESAKDTSSIDYLAGKRVRLPKATEQLLNLSDEWLRVRRAALRDYREIGKRARPGQLDYLAEQALEGTILRDVGMGRVAWMERSITSVAMLLDYRSRRFGQRMLKLDDPEKHRVEAQMADEAYEGHGIEWTPQKVQQARAAWTFASEWQRYLNELLISPPQSRKAESLLAEFSHCRPCGAFFTKWMHDEWLNAGGREECRKPLFCPHCYARQSTRLVARVEEGPWSEGRRVGKHLVMLRLTVSTPDLMLNPGKVHAEREQREYCEWLPPSLPEYSSDCPEEAKINRIDANQRLEHTLTEYEVREAAAISKELVEVAKSLGVTGGLRFHQIGPSKRQFEHELGVVGEISNREVQRVEAHLGVGAENHAPLLHGQSIECVMVPGTYKDAARILLAGTSYGFDLRKVGARFNQASRMRAYCLSSNSTDTFCRPVGLRGTMAWPPLFLLSVTSYWSRYTVLRSGRHRTYHAFGRWRTLLRADQKYRSPVQQERWMKNGGPLKEGWSYDPIRRIEHQRGQLGISVDTLAKTAGYSRTAVYRLLKDGHGSADLIKAVKTALLSIQKEINTTPTSKFTKPEDVRGWLNAYGKSISWLATEIGWNRSRVSRLLAGKSVWQESFAQEVTEIAERLMTEET